ncbi:N-acyl homoserine lactonase family protein [Spirosoma arcticum]
MRTVRLITFLTVSLFSLNGCRPQGNPETPLRVYIFQRGQLISNDASVVSAGINQGQRLVLGNTCFLIQHPRGTLLWDTGLSDSIVAYPDGKQEGPALLRLNRTLTDQLAQIGITPDEVDYLALSHCHTDHAGNANLFRKAQFLIQREEYQLAYGPDASQYYYNPAFYNQLTNIRQIEGDFDVFGDGRVVIMSAPGHTPGHQVLFLNLPRTGPVLLSGDLYHHQLNRQLQAMPVFNFSRPQTLRSMMRLEAFLTRTGAQLWIQHDSAFNAMAHFAPDFVE